MRRIPPLVCPCRINTERKTHGRIHTGLSVPTHMSHPGHQHAVHHDGPHGQQAAPARAPIPHAHDAHAGHSPRMFRDRFWISAMLTVPAVIWSGHIEMLLHYRAPAVPGANWIPAVFGTLVFLYGGRAFRQGAWLELRARLPVMMTLISLAITVAFVFSWIVELKLIRADALWWELATLVTIMLLGHWIEMRAIQRAEGALQELAKLLPATATRITAGHEEVVAIGELRTGEIVLVRPGESVPVDGVVRKGESAVNESLITGESRPVQKREGDQVIAGTINGEGSLRVDVTGTGENTKLSKIMRLVAKAQQSKSRTQHLADRAAQMLTGVAIAAALLTMVVWQLLGAPVDFSVVRVVTGRVIACPHALGLAVPLVVAISTTLGARAGLLVRDRRGLEEARALDTVIFDKTGTLTLGEFRVVDLSVADGTLQEDALRIAAAVEGDSEHPIARGIVKTAEERGIALPAAAGFRALSGKGVAASVDGAEYHLGGPALLRGENVSVPPALATADIGIAIGSGTDVAVGAGHIVLVCSDPRDIPRIVTLSRATYRKMVQNLWWAAGYNIFAIPLAAGVLASRGILLTPAVGAVLMSASTIIVSLNAQLLKRVRL